MDGGLFSELMIIRRFLQEHVIILTRDKGCLSENHERYLQELTSLLNRMAQKLGPHIVQYSPSVTALSL